MDADVCYAYLDDVPGNCPLLDDEYTHPMQMRYVEAFDESKWFTRGWTLQELLAPKMILFFDRVWVRIGNKSELEKDISSATRIDVYHLWNPQVCVS